MAKLFFQKCVHPLQLFSVSNSEDMTPPFLSQITILVHSGSSSLHSSSGTSYLCALMELPSFPPPETNPKSDLSISQAQIATKTSLNTLKSHQQMNADEKLLCSAK